MYLIKRTRHGDTCYVLMPGKPGDEICAKRVSFRYGNIDIFDKVANRFLIIKAVPSLRGL